MKKSPLQLIFFTVGILYSALSTASNVDNIIAEKQAPVGVVFEIVSGSPTLLNKLLPVVKSDILRLRKRFPGISIAIVTHGTEQFGLTIENSKKQSVAHSITKELVSSNDVNVHVCGTHASWFDISPEDFPDYVDVTPAGPTQINDYEELGYELIVLP